MEYKKEDIAKLMQVGAFENRFKMKIINYSSSKSISYEVALRELYNDFLDTMLDNEVFLYYEEWVEVI